MGDAATLLDQLRAELPALGSLPETAALMASAHVQVHELGLRDELLMSPDRVALLARGQLALYAADRFDRIAAAPHLCTWWASVPTRLEALTGSTVISFDRSHRGLAFEDEDGQQLINRFASTADALADERALRDRLRERFQYGGDDAFLRVREAYTGLVDSRQFVVRCASWPWSGEAPERALLSLADYEQVGSAGSDPEDQLAYRQATLWAPTTGGLRLVLAWADHARAVRLGRELYGFKLRFGRVEVLDEDRTLLAIDGQPRLLATAVTGAPTEAGAWRAELGLPSGPLRLRGHEHRERWSHRPPETLFRWNEDTAWHLEGTSLELLDEGLGAGFEILSATRVRGRFQIAPAPTR